MAEEIVATEIAVEAAVSPVASDNKRKLEDLEPKEETPAETPDESSAPPSDTPQEEADVKPSEDENDSVPDAKRPRLEEESDGSVLENGHDVSKPDEAMVESAPSTTVENVEADNGENLADNGENLTSEDIKLEKVEDQPVENVQAENEEKASEQGEGVTTTDLQPPEGDLQQPIEVVPQQTEFSSEPQYTAAFSEQGDGSSEHQQGLTASRKMEIPNNKVGVLIGKAGDTIKYLQQNSGAKIQITRDSEADPNSSTRPVELIGTLEQIDKAEQLINAVIAEAEAGGSPSLVARGFGAAQSTGPAEQIELQVPNEKVGLIIGKGGETIKSLQTKSGARIQLIPQHLPEGDQSRERTVRVTGDKKQIVIASEMIKDVMNQPVRQNRGGYNQQSYRPRGSGGQSQWAPRAPNSGQGTGYDYQQRGMYQSQNPQYMAPSYGGYPPQQPTPRSNYNAGWEQRPAGPQGGGYDYYPQGGHASDPSASVPANSAPATGGGAPPAQVNYNYGQPQGPEYGQPTGYAQPTPNQNYGHGYEDPKYANQVSAQPAYGGHVNAQTGGYPQQAGNQQGYVQQPYAKPPTYGMQQGQAQQAYGPPRASQPGDPQYQNQISQYGQNVPSQQPYPYAAGGVPQQTYPYGTAPAANDGYSQAPPHSGPAPVYPQQGGPPVQGYGQSGGQPAQGYVQGGQTGGYGAYPPAQQGYAEQQSVPNSGGYGYQGPGDAGYGSAPPAAYGAQQNAQASYVQPASNQPGYEQQIPQSGGYANVPGGAPVGYVKNLSPQPVYGQYDQTQMYGHH